MTKSKGITLVGLLLTMAVIILGGIVVMRIVPVYLQHYTITSAIGDLSGIDPTEMSEDPALNVITLKKHLMKIFDVNSIEDVKDSDVTITPQGPGSYKVEVRYKTITPLFGNVKLLFEFDDIKEVTVGA